MITQSKPVAATTARDYCRILFRHKQKALSCFAIVLGAAVVAVLFWPRTYKSESKLFVHVGRETVTLDPTATTGQLLPVSLSTDTEVNSVLEMLRSRIMVEKLVDELGPATILYPSTEGAASPSALSKLASLVQIDPVSDREKAINRVTRCLDTEVEKKSDVITISGKAESPELAQRIVAKFVEIYFGEHARMHHTPGSQAFFAEQKSLLQKQLTAALEKLRDAKNQMGIVSIENHRRVLQEETIAVENKLAQARAALAASTNKIDALRQKVEGVPERLATDETQGMPNAAADKMRADLYQLEMREAELASRFTDEFPALVAVREQILAAKKPLNQEAQRRTQQTTGVSVVHDQLQVGLLNEESNLASLEAETKSLEKQLTELQNRGRNLNENELLVVSLEQEVSLCKANYATYSEKSEESRINSALQEERITNVNVIQPASLITKPVSPHKAAILVLGLIGGLLLGAGAAFLAEYLDPTLKTADEVEESLALPVLGAIPKAKVGQRQTVLN